MDLVDHADSLLIKGSFLIKVIFLIAGSTSVFWAGGLEFALAERVAGKAIIQNCWFYSTLGISGASFTLYLHKLFFGGLFVCYGVNDLIAKKGIALLEGLYLWWFLWEGLC